MGQDSSVVISTASYATFVDVRTICRINECTTINVLPQKVLPFIHLYGTDSHADSNVPIFAKPPSSSECSTYIQNSVLVNSVSAKTGTLKKRSVTDITEFSTFGIRSTDTVSHHRLVEPC